MRQSPQTVQNVITYDVVVSVDNSDLALKPGLTAATRIIIDRRSDVLRVPNQALRYVPTGTVLGETKQSRVWVLRDGRRRQFRLRSDWTTTTSQKLCRAT